jgi:hypothetical protein
MKIDFRSQTTRLVTAGKTKVQSIQAQILSRASTIFRFLKLQLSTLTRLSPSSTLLKIMAVGAAALMVMLAIGGLQTIAGGAGSGKQISKSATAQPHASGWSNLPGAALPKIGSAKPQPAQAKKTADTQAQKAQAKPQDKSAAKPSAAKPGVKPAAKPSQPSASQPPAPAPQALSPVPATVLAQSSLSAYAPPQEAAPANPTNYGDRYAKDVFGRPAQNEPLVVLHETVGSASSAINTFQAAHLNENAQSSYHSIIRRDGTVVYVVPPEKRAYGAGNSVFKSAKGEETVKTHQQFPPSVNNFAYHISLETPPDGANEAETHSGYTDAQYRSLAWLVAHTSIPDDRITTHRAIDRSGSRIDPRSFQAEKFYSALHSLPRPYATGG